MSLREKYLAANGRNVRTVSIPEWGDVRLRGMSGTQRARIESLIAAKKSDIELMWYAVACCVVDEADAPVFSEQDVPQLLDDMASSIPIRLMPHIDELNGFGSKAAKDIEGNSVGTASADGS